jgi:uncharacterized membrane protein
MASRKSQTRRNQELARQNAALRRRVELDGPAAPTQGAFAQISTSYSGMMPPPAMVREFGELIPNFGERMFTLAEDQARHRMKLESEVTTSDGRRSWAGLAVGGLVSLCVIASGTAVAMAGHPTAGASIISTTVVALAGVFVVGANSRKAERQRKYGKTSRNG